LFSLEEIFLLHDLLTGGNFPAPRPTN
jgi:hypothetical protein